MRLKAARPVRVSRPNSQPRSQRCAAPWLAVCVPLWDLRSRPWQNTFLPSLVPVKDGPPPTKRGLCVCVCEGCVWQSVWLPGCSQAVSEAVLPALRSCSCVCMCVGFCVCVCVPALRWVMTQRKDSEHTVLNST